SINKIRSAFDSEFSERALIPISLERAAQKHDDAGKRDEKVKIRRIDVHGVVPVSAPNLQRLASIVTTSASRRLPSGRSRRLASIDIAILTLPALVALIEAHFVLELDDLGGIDILPLLDHLVLDRGRIIS